MTSRRPLGLCALLALALLSLAAGPARADDRPDETVGVVVTGEATMQPQLVAQIETWLRMHGHDLVSTPLPPEAISALIDCFVIEDPACARSVVEKRAQTGSIVFAQVTLDSGQTAQDRTVTLTVHWLDKGKDVRSEQRLCERCTDGTLRNTADALMTALTGDDEPRGRVQIRSSPSGAKVSVDGKEIGRTPISPRLLAGDHTIVLELGARLAETRSVTVEAGQVSAVSVEFPEPPLSLRQKLGIAALASGALLGATGGFLIAIDEDDIKVPTRTRYHTETMLGGVALVASGAAVLGVGIYLLATKPGERSAPTVSLAPGGGVLGWTGQF